MTILDRFERKTIEIHGPDGIERHPCWCYGEFALCDGIFLDGEPVWNIASIPRGMLFPINRLGAYRTVEDAAQAVLDLSRLHNSWSSLDSFSANHVKQLTAIREKNNGVEAFSKQLIRAALDPKIREANARAAFLNNAKREDYT